MSRAEAALIGAVLIDNRVVEEMISHRCCPEHYLRAGAQRIYGRVLPLAGRSRGGGHAPVATRALFGADRALQGAGQGGPSARGLLPTVGITPPARELAAQIYDLALLRTGFSWPKSGLPAPRRFGKRRAAGSSNRRKEIYSVAEGRETIPEPTHSARRPGRNQNIERARSIQAATFRARPPGLTSVNEEGWRAA